MGVRTRLAVRAVFGLVLMAAAVALVLSSRHRPVDSVVRTGGIPGVAGVDCAGRTESSIPGVRSSGGEPAADYWTEERMREASPYPISRDPSAPVGGAGGGEGCPPPSAGGEAPAEAGGSVPDDAGRNPRPVASGSGTPPTSVTGASGRDQLPSSDAPGARSDASDNERADYWTEERMREASPYPMPPVTRGEGREHQGQFDGSGPSGDPASAGGSAPSSPRNE